MFRSIKPLVAASVFGLAASQSYSNESESFLLTGEVYASKNVLMSPSLDGIGTLYVALLESCDLKLPPIGVAVVPNADVSGGKSVAFEFASVTSGKYFLAIFLDEHSLKPTGAPIPNKGDIVYSTTGFGDGQIDCLEVSSPQKEELNVALTGRRP